MTVNPYLDDFIGRIKYVKGKEMQGLSTIAKIVGIGMVEWDFQNDYGVKYIMCIKANFIPDTKFRLFSPHAYLLEHKIGLFYLDHNGTVFTFAEAGSLSFNYTRGSILPFAVGTKIVRSPKGLVGESIRVAVNLITGQIELQNTNNKLGYYNIRKKPSLFRGGNQSAPVLNHICPQAITCKVPLCWACIMGKARLQSMGNTNSTPHTNHPNLIENNDLVPRVRVSSDQYMCRIKGRWQNTIKLNYE